VRARIRDVTSGCSLVDLEWSAAAGSQDMPLVRTSLVCRPMSFCRKIQSWLQL
jgi:hypothetical protein